MTPVPASLRSLWHPLRERAIQALTSRRGVPRIVNGVPLRVDARSRRTFTAEYDTPVADCIPRRGDGPATAAATSRRSWPRTGSMPSR